MFLEELDKAWCRSADETKREENGLGSFMLAGANYLGDPY